jgi:hypothetical protein
VQRVWIYCWHVGRRFSQWEEETMNRKTLIFSIMAGFALPKPLFSKTQSETDLVLKNGWILKKEDFLELYS